MMEQYSRHLTAIHCPGYGVFADACVTQTGMRQQAACAGKMIIICNYGNSCASGSSFFALAIFWMVVLDLFSRISRSASAPCAIM